MCVRPLVGVEVKSENPIISLVQGRPDWEYDDVFHFKCSMNGTRPASRLSWLLNGAPVSPSPVVILLFSLLSLSLLFYSRPQNGPDHVPPIAIPLEKSGDALIVSRVLDQFLPLFPSCPFLVDSHPSRTSSTVFRSTNAPFWTCPA